MYSNQPSDNIDMALDGIDRSKLIQAFQILGLPVGIPNINSRGEVLDDFAVEDSNEPIYWNDRKTAPGRSVNDPVWMPELHEDVALSTPREPKTDWDMPVQNGLV